MELLVCLVFVLVYVYWYCFLVGSVLCLFCCVLLLWYRDGSCCSCIGCIGFVVIGG